VQANAANANISGPIIGMSRSVGVFTIDREFAYRPFDPACPGYGGEINAIIPNRGPGVGGNTVTVIGTGLGNGTDITSADFGKDAATILSQNRTQVVIRPSPAQDGPANVVIESYCGGFTLSGKNYTFDLSMFARGCAFVY
jgi:hypothetical protein